MSTILDALRKVERERDPTAEPNLDEQPVSPEGRRRPPFPVVAVVICAVVGFGGGALLSRWLTSEPGIEVTELPVSPPPPEIEVPRAPTREEPVRPIVPPVVADAGAAKVEASTGGSAAAPPAAEPSAAPRSVATPATVVALQAKEVVPEALEAPRPATGDASSSAEEIARPAPPQGTALAAVDQGSALEPSPFGPARDGIIRESVRPSVKPAPADEEEIAALAPQGAPAAPQLDEAPEEALVPEPEPETPGETLFDTGRSPAGAPKVALSFLQWSPDPARRFAFISIDGAPTQRIHEGEVAAGLTVAAITPTGVQFKRDGTIFVIRPRH